MKTQHTLDYVAHGCAIYSADDWRDGTNHGGKIVASTALNLIDEDHEDDMPENAEGEFAETIAAALNSAPALLAENARLRGILGRVIEYVDEYVNSDDADLDRIASVADEARAALQGGGL